MKNFRLSILAAVAMTFFLCNPITGQLATQETIDRKFWVGSSLFMFGNFSSENNPGFAQLNFGYRFSPKNAVSLELITWKYAWPLGIPFGDDFEAPEFEYPGHIREFGFAFAYQHFWWKGLYSSVHALNAFQKYTDENGDKIQNGYQLFLTYRIVGYHFKFFKNRVFVEPSVAITHWPINTNVPASFEKQDQDWPNYFLFEPGLHFGIKF